MGRQRADIVTISHPHPHHSHYAGIEGNPRVLQGPGEYEIANFYIVGMGTERNDPQSEPETNTIYAIHCEGVTLCHLGDLNRVLSPRQIEELSHVDVIFVPAGGVCTIDPSRAAELVNLIGPNIVVPIHYQTEGVGIGIQPLDAFLADMGVEEPSRASKLIVTDSNLPRDMRVVVLQRAT
jgi:L-ascorbate metabolism protein UlaG (beta-lactamase superfamily)